MRIAIYPGTFDPVTNGHLDIIRRASKLFDQIIVAVSNNIQKNPFFTLQERVSFVEDSVKGIKNVRVESFQGLLVEYAGSKKASVLVRGLRVISDFEYEFQMALMNRKLMSDLETVYLMPSEEYVYLNSTIVKEVALLGGNIDCFVPAVVASALSKKIIKMAKERNKERK